MGAAIDLAAPAEMKMRSAPASATSAGTAAETALVSVVTAGAA